MKNSLLMVIATMLFACPLVFGQADTGTIEGIVTDTEGGVIPGATVTGKNVATGMTRIDTTSINGGFRLSAMPPGVYNVTVELAGFATVIHENVTVNVGKSIDLDFQLTAAKVAETVTVTAEAPLVESTESDLSTIVNEKLISNLPLNGRKFQDLALMAPGVRTGNYYDPTKTEIGGTSMGGQQGRTTFFSIDGGDDRDTVVGGLLQQYPQEAIQEYEVTTQRFKAEYGRSPQGVVSVVTKSGTNEFSGSIFGFFRDDSLNSNNYFNEKVRIQGEDIDRPDDPSDPNHKREKPPFSQQMYGGSFGGPIAQDKAFFFATYEHNTRNDYTTIDTGGRLPSEEGNFAKPFKNDMVVAKANFNISSDNNMYVRYGMENNKRDHDFIGGNTLKNSGAKNTNKFHSVLAADTWVLSADKLNEIHFQYSYFKNDIRAERSDLPAIVLPSYNFGANLNTPQQTIQKRYQIRDDFSMRKTGWMGDHDMKIGVEIIRTHFGGFFVPTLYGVFRYDTDDYQNAQATSFSGSASLYSLEEGGGGANENWHYFAGYYQDDWKVSNKLTINAGLRYEVEFGPFEYRNATKPGDLVNSLGPGTGLTPTSDRKTDTNNLGPRIGFAYDVAGDAKTVIRGGYGLYYDELFQNITLYEGWMNYNNPTQFVSFANPDFTPEDYIKNKDYYRRIWFTPDWTGQVLRMTENSLVQPYSQQFSIGASRQLTDRVAFDADYVHVLSLDEVHRRVVNGGNARAGYADRSTAIMWPDYGPIYLEGNRGHSMYDALQVAMRARYSKMSLQASYAYSKAKNIANDFNTQPSNQNDWEADWGYAPNDQTHVFALGGVFALPWDFQVSSVVAARSGKPFNTRAGQNLDNQGGSGADRPTPGVTVLPDGSIYSGTADRNANRASNFISLDFRVSKIFRLGDRAGIEALFEVFNLTNHANFDVDNYITSIRSSADASTLTNGFGDPTNAFAPRQAQFGLKFTF
ncbi:MAG: carboxypeptidase regulatory-like domain-containing protein [Acidobacteriota bacterium]